MIKNLRGMVSSRDTMTDSSIPLQKKEQASEKTLSYGTLQEFC